MISTGHLHYQLKFCHPHTYATFVRAVKSGSSFYRIGFIGVERLRIFVSVLNGKVLLEPYIRRDNSWEPHPRPRKATSPDVEQMCHSAQEYENELAKVFFDMFPRAEETFWDTFPNHQDVIAKLNVNPTSGQLDDLMLIYTYDDDVSIDDADGYVSISCDDGTLCIPFDYVGNTKRLQMYRAKFHPGDLLVSFFNGICELGELWWSRLRSFTFVGLLQHIDNLVK